MYISLQIVLLAALDIVGVFLGFVVYRNNIKNKMNISFGIMALAALIWVNSSFFGFLAGEANQSSLFFKINYAAVAMFLAIAYRFFVIDFSGNRRRIFSNLIFIVSSAISLGTVFTDIVINGVNITGSGREIVYGDFVGIYNIYSLIVAVLILYFIIKKYGQASEKEKLRIQYFLVGTIIYAVMNIVFNIIFPVFFSTVKYSWLGDYSVVIFIGFTAYAILRNHLFDIKFAIIRTVAYSFVLITLACLYLVITFPLSRIFDNQPTNPFQIASGVGTSLILAFAFQSVKRFFDKVTDKIFYKDHYKTDDFYYRLNDALTLDTDLRGILERASNEVVKTIKCEQAFFFINTTDGHYVSAGTQNHKKLLPPEASKIIEYCGNDYRAIVTSMLDTDISIRWLLLSRGIEVTLPLVQSGKIFGFLLLGDHLTSGYTSRDIRALNTVADGLVIAIQNALSVQKILELNSTLQQKVLVATKELRTTNLSLRRLDKAKDEFVSVAAHELRTPMTVIRGFVNLLEREQLGKINSKQKEVLSKMSLNAKNLIDLVNNMLDLSKLEANKLSIQLSDNYIDDMVSESLEKIDLLYQSKGVSLKYNGENARVVTDPEKFERILVNLLSNAYKFTASGGKVTISNKVDIQKGVVTMIVADTGLGISPDGIAKLFKKFSQVDNYLQKSAGGTGLGLSICKQMVEKMGGDIWVESEVGKGSQFYFTMPLSKQ